MIQNLQLANFRGANFQQAYLEGANLQQANLRRASLKEANLGRVNLRGANLQRTFLTQTENLTNKQIKSACFWEQAIYKGKFDFEKKDLITFEPDNTNYIENLKKDISSNPEDPFDCTVWEDKEN